MCHFALAGFSLYWSLVNKFPLAKICQKAIEMFTIMQYNSLMIMKHKRQGMIL